LYCQVPIIIHRRDLEKIAPRWLAKTRQIRDDRANWPNHWTNRDCPGLHTAQPQTCWVVAHAPNAFLWIESDDLLLWIEGDNLLPDAGSASKVGLSWTAEMFGYVFAVGPRPRPAPPAAPAPSLFARPKRAAPPDPLARRRLAGARWGFV
jgi:hypothetical protein